MIIFFALILHWYLSLFFQTIFLHRYASHNMFKMTPFVEKVFYFLTFLFQGSSFLHPAAYGVMHKDIMHILIHLMILIHRFILKILFHLISRLLWSTESLLMILLKVKEATLPFPGGK